MNGRRFAGAIGVLVAAGLVTVALASSAAARPQGSESARAGGSVAVAAQPAPVRMNAEARRLIRRATARMGSLRASGSGEICLGGSTDSNTPQVQTCTFGGSSGICIQQSTDPGASQTCTFTQTSSGRNNLAIVLQVIVQRDPASSSSQSGMQTANVAQQNTTKSNLSFVVQIVKQSLGTGADNADNEASAVTAAESTGESHGVLPSFSSLISSLMATEPLQEGDEPATPATYAGDITQTQQSQQDVNVCQGGPSGCGDSTGMTGSNLSSIYQSLRMRERASNADSITQQQNPSPATCSTSLSGTTNMCAVVVQNTTAPAKNASGLAQLYRQFQSGSNTHLLTQSQDPNLDANGLDHDVQQTSFGAGPGSPKLDTILTFQWGHQVQRASHSDTVVQTQDPRVGKGPESSQQGSSADTWNGTQLAQQVQTVDGQFTSNPDQFQQLSYDGTSSGTIDATQTGTQNGSTDTETCSGSSCHIGVTCTNGEIPEVSAAAAAAVDACEATPIIGSVMLRR